MGDAATPVLPDFTSQTAAAYKANIDAAFAVADRVAWAFAPHEQDVGSPQPDMTVRLEAGAVFDGTTLIEVAEQDTPPFTAPTTNPRIDRIVVDKITGIVSVVTGTEDPSPTAPAITAGKIPIAQVALTTSTTKIIDSDITDERDFGLLGGIGINALPALDDGSSPTPVINDNDQVPIYDVSAGVEKKVPVSDIGAFSSGTLMLFQQTAAPTGWTKQTTHNDKSLRVVSGAASSGGATAFSSVFGSGKVSGSHTLTEAEMPAHTHNAGTSNSAATGDTAPQNFRNTATGNLATSSTGGGGGHTHTLSLDLQFVDLIIASKD